MNKKNLSFSLTIFLLLLGMFSHAQSGSNGQISLAGTWAFAIDSLDKGVTEKWFLLNLKQRVRLPGSMTTNGKGDDVSLKTPWTGDTRTDGPWWNDDSYAKYRQPGNIKISFWLQPGKVYVGPAWYQKEIIIPQNWSGKRLEIFFERCHWETILWLDGRRIGLQNALGAPHIFDLGADLKPGKHKITVRVDNRIKDIDPGSNASSVSDNTQTNWNGIVGKMTLTARSQIYVSDMQLYPDIKQKNVVAKLKIANLTNKPATVKLVLNARQWQGQNKERLPAMIKSVTADKDSTWVTLTYPMGAKPALWDEFTPNLYKMTLQLRSESGLDETSSTFGMRKFSSRGRRFTVNDRPVFLRGTLECAIFPLTGYPATDEASWARIFSICKSYGLNHMRFHSWCPPQAAFDAADKAGIYLSVECSAWAAIGDGRPIDQYLYDESSRIIEEFGNHPSFCMMLYGNEPAGAHAAEYLARFVQYWQSKDPRHLYSSGAGWPVISQSDFNVTYGPRIATWGDGPNSVFNNGIPRTDYNWSSIIEQWPQPTISHELGQWCVYPDFNEVKKYTGVLKPKNFDIFYDRLKTHHLEHLADSFFYASGKLQVLCYKAEIEAQFRTKEIAGFQLLDLHDFPGQGTALVGVLDPFWNSKPYVTAKQYRQFCDSTVPLFVSSRLVYVNSDTLQGDVEVAHFGRQPIMKVKPGWQIKNKKGKVLFKGQLEQTTIEVGAGVKLGHISQPLASVQTPQQLSLEINIAGHRNNWDLFVYPRHVPEPDKSIYITQALDDEAVRRLNYGGNVLLTIKKGAVKPELGGNIQVGFSPIFWNLYWSRNQPPHTLGILCNPDNPALAQFPTEYHSNFQWQDGMIHSNALLLDSICSDIQPIVRVIDDWYTVRPLGLIFECRVGKGKLLVSGIDLLTDKENRPEARQLLYSLSTYMATGKFNPTVKVDFEKIKNIFN